MHTHLIRFPALALCSAFAVFGSLGARGGENPPNVLFIAVDDLRPELGCYGNRQIKSPHIDALAENAVTFERAYCQQAVCNPSRASLMTGLRPDSTKVWDLVTDFRTTIPGAVTIPQHFRKHGYRAVSYGKIFHNTFPDNESWDEPHHWPKDSRLWSPDAQRKLAEFRRKMRDEGKSEAAIRRMRAAATEIVDYSDSEHIDGAIADQAIAAMRRLARSKHPLFLAVGFIRPHLPFVAPRKYWELYERDKIPLADNPLLPREMPGVAFGDRSLGGFYELRVHMDFAGATSPFSGSLSETQQRELKHGYYASVSLIDAQIGRLLAELDRLGLRDNTIIVLWGDHGWKLGEHNGWCKQTNFEIDTRSPLIISAPRAKANGQSCNSLVEFVDVYPTLCDLAGLPVPTFLEGISLKPILDDTSAKVKDAAFSQFPRRHEGREYMGYAMRTDRYRYVEWLDRATAKTVASELYDHRTDSQENANVVDDPSNRDTVWRLAEQLWAALDRPDPRPPAKRGPAAVNQTNRPVKPNILVLMGDDWSWPHAGAYGDPAARTPTFDRLAREGVLFNNAFVSSPSCTPSRFAVATGQWHWRLGEGASLGGSLAADVPVYPEILETAGYRIGFARKGGAPSEHVYRKRDPFGDRFESFQAFLASQPADKSFCFWYGAGEPHRPYRAGTGRRAGFDPSAVKVPRCLPDHPTVRSDLCDYLERIERFDSDSAKMLAVLEERGLRDNTIVVVAGDNGMPFPRCKATLYDTGTHVPLIIHWPDRFPGARRVDDFVSLTDLAPTFLEVTGRSVPDVMTGRSLMPILSSRRSGQVDPKRSFTLTGMERHVFSQPARAIRTSEFLYIRNFDLDKWPTIEKATPLPQIDYEKGEWLADGKGFPLNLEQSPTLQLLLDHRDDPGLKPYYELATDPRPEEEFYDVQADPAGCNNIADDSKYAQIKAELRGKLEAELRASDDPRVAQAEKPGTSNRKTATALKQDPVDFNHPPRNYASHAVHGWTVLVEEQLAKEAPHLAQTALVRLKKKLAEATEVLPTAALPDLRKLTIFLMYGPKSTAGGRASGLEYFQANAPKHHDWLDPRMASSIVIFSAENYAKLSEFWALKSLVHELGHAHHLEHWPEQRADIYDTWDHAMKSGLYQAVGEEDKTAHMPNYAAQNHLEYFAELTAIYFVGCNYSPKDCAALKAYDPKGYTLVQQLWGVTDAQ